MKKQQDVLWRYTRTVAAVTFFPVVLLQQREEAAAAAQLLQLQAEALVTDSAFEFNGTLPVSVTATDGQKQQQQEHAPAVPADASCATAVAAGWEQASRALYPTVTELERGPGGGFMCQWMRPLSDADSASLLLEDVESGNEDEEDSAELGSHELAEKKWKAYLKEQASPMADFFAGQARSGRGLRVVSWVQFLV